MSTDKTSVSSSAWPISYFSKLLGEVVSTSPDQPKAPGEAVFWDAVCKHGERMLAASLTFGANGVVAQVFTTSFGDKTTAHALIGFCRYHEIECEILETVACLDHEGGA